MPRSADTTSPSGLTEAALAHVARQDGLVTRSQLLDSGVSKATIRWRAGRTWLALLPSVYLVTGGPPTHRQREIGALLWGGGRAYLTGSAAARHHGMILPPLATLEMLAPAPARSRSHGFASLRRTTIDDPAVVSVGPLRYASAARAVLDLAHARPGSAARSALLIEAVQRGVTSPEELHAWICRLRTRDAARLLRPLEHAASGAWSVPEVQLLELVATSSILPEPMLNPTLRDEGGRRLLTPDVWFDEVAMAVMVHSHLFHSTGRDWVQTVESDGELTRRGVLVLGITPTGMREDPVGTLRRVEDSHAIAARRPRPGVVATPRPVVRSA